MELCCRKDTKPIIVPFRFAVKFGRTSASPAYASKADSIPNHSGSLRRIASAALAAIVRGPSISVVSKRPSD